jgi:hypothetical protein
MKWKKIKRILIKSWLICFIFVFLLAIPYTFDVMIKKSLIHMINIPFYVTAIWLAIKVYKDI